MSYQGFKKAKETVRQAGAHSPASCKALVVALYGHKKANRLIAEYKANPKSKRRSWLQAVFHSACLE